MEIRLYDLLPFNWFLRISPLYSFFISWSIGLLLVISSYLLGVGKFYADITLSLASAPAKHLSLALGYAQQLNYGPWYGLPICCPFVFCLCSYLYSQTVAQTPAIHCRTCNFQELTKRPSVMIIGFFVFSAFIFENVIVEARDYKHLSFGWVQAETLQREGEIASVDHSSVPIPRTFYLFDDKSTLIHAEKVLLDRTAPAGFQVRNHRLFMAFIVVAKIWLGFWQGLVVYVSVLLCYWGFGAVAAITHDATITDSDVLAKLSIKWARPIVLVSLLIGLEGNLFSIVRFIANAAKGTFGSWDQYLSAIVLAPPFIFSIIAIVVIGKVLRIDSSQVDALATKLELSCWLLWLGSAGILAHLLIGFTDPITTGIISIATSVSTTKLN